MVQPDRLTTFFGRETEIAQLRELLVFDRTRRLVTLVGPGGVGKTRLAHQVIAAVSNDFGGDVFFVDLSPIRDASQVAPAIARTLNIPVQSDREIEELLREELTDRELLLVIDNFEQVMAADLVIWTLVAHCPRIVVLITSREPLHIEGQLLYDVLPFDVPHDPGESLIDEIRLYPALQLFDDRARSVRSEFRLTADNVGDVARVCNSLAGLPLAIELAAARVRYISIRELASGLDRMLDLLTRGSHNLPSRHRTLRGAIAWSYDLLAPAEQRMFRRLAVFAGGCTVDTVQTVLNERAVLLDGLDPGADRGQESEDSIQLLSSLFDKNLVITKRAGDGTTRFTLLEPIRLFALEQLRANDEEQDELRAHALTFLALAEEAFPQLRGENPAPWIARLEIEQDNFLSALQWSISCGEAESETALRLANALWLFWRLRGDYHNAKNWLERALAAAGESVTTARADAWLLLGHAIDDDDRRSAECYEQGRKLYRALGDKRSEAGALSCLGMAAEHIGDYPLALKYHEESLALFKEHGEPADIAQAEHQLGTVAASVKNYPRAKAHLEDARSHFVRLGRSIELAYTLLELGRIAGLERRFREADDILMWSLNSFRASEMPDGIGRVLCELGALALQRDDLASATGYFKETLTLFTELNWEIEWVVASVEGIAIIAIAAGRHEFGTELLGAAASWRETTGRKTRPVQEAAIERAKSRARRSLRDSSYSEAWQRGHLLIRLEEAIRRASEYGLGSPGSGTRTSAPPRTSHVNLTRQQRVVLCYVAEGWSNQQIADKINVSNRTVTTHMTEIFRRLDTENRAGAAAYAVRNGICPPT